MRIKFIISTASQKGCTGKIVKSHHKQNYETMKLINFPDLGRNCCALLTMKHISPLALVFTYDSYLYLLQNISSRKCGEICFTVKKPWADLKPYHMRFFNAIVQEIWISLMNNHPTYVTESTFSCGGVP